MSSFNRSNPRITFDQYLVLLRLKKRRDQIERGTFAKLVRHWGMPQSTVASAVTRGIKAYDYKLWKSGVQL